VIFSEDKSVLSGIESFIKGCRKPCRGDFFVLGMAPNEGNLIRSGLLTCSESNLAWADDLTVEDYLSLSVHLLKEPLKSKMAMIFQVLKEHSFDPDQYLSSLSLFDCFRLSCLRTFVLDSSFVLVREPEELPAILMTSWLRTFFAKLKTKGIPALFLTSKLAPDFQLFFDEVLFIVRGKIVGEGKPSELLQRELGSRVLRLQCSMEERGYLINRIKERGFNFFSDSQNLFICHLRPNQGWELIKEFGVTTYEFSAPTFDHLLLKWRGV
jgi:ABC-type multidrug transport system ATPase subunit